MKSPPWNEVLGRRLSRFPVYAVSPERRTDTTSHRQLGLEFNLTCEGKGRLTVESSDFEISPGCLVIVPQGIAHRLVADGRVPYVRTVLCVATDSRHRLPRALLERAEFAEPALTRLSDGNASRFRDLIARIAEETRLQPPGWEEASLALSIEAAVLALRSLIALGRDVQAGSLASRVAGFVREHLDEDLPTESIAARFGLSREHLSRAFARELGVPLHRYVVATRIAEARRLLVMQGDWTVLDVALATGFCSHAHFTRIFREFEGVTPTQYRQLQRLG